jgi:hypothetical protein
MAEKLIQIFSIVTSNKNISFKSFLWMMLPMIGPKNQAEICVLLNSVGWKDRGCWQNIGCAHTHALCDHHTTEFLKFNLRFYMLQCTDSLALTSNWVAVMALLST